MSDETIPHQVDLQEPPALPIWRPSWEARRDPGPSDANATRATEDLFAGIYDPA